MILKIVILVLSFLIASLLLVFISTVFIPAFKEKTGIDSNMFFSKHQHEFSKLKPVEPLFEVTEKAFVMCNCGKNFEKKPFLKTQKGQTCALINSIYGSMNDCKFSCIGLGDCIKVCPQHSIVIKNETAVVTNLCIGCGKCVDECPKKLIKLVPVNEQIQLKCQNNSLSLTSCDSFDQPMEKNWTEKNGFRIWQSCYNIFYHK